MGQMSLSRESMGSTSLLQKKVWSVWFKCSIIPDKRNSNLSVWYFGRSCAHAQAKWEWTCKNSVQCLLNLCCLTCENLCHLLLGYNVSLVFDLDNVPSNHQELVRKCGLLKRNCFASVFEKYFEFQRNEEGGQKRAVIQYRDDETMYVRVI